MKFRWADLDVPTLTFFIVTTLGALIGPIWYFQNFAWSWWILVYVLVFGAIAGMSITGGYHRLFAHRSYEANRIVRLAYLFFGASAFQGSALQWCSDHRIHHRHVDTDKDPYSIRKGFFYAHIGWLFDRRHPRYQNPFPNDLTSDPWMLFQHRYYVPIALLAGFGLPTLMGWFFDSAAMGFWFGGVVRLVIGHHGTFFINSACHTFGRQPYSDSHTAKDNAVLAFLTYGEGYHNYHHEFQFDYRNGIRWYQWDPTKWWIQALSGLGLASKLRRVSEGRILQARLKMQKVHLQRRGVWGERLLNLSQRVEEAYQRAEKLRSDYAEFEKTIRNREQFQRLQVEVLRLKAEWQMARVEFQKSYAQWKIYLRTLERLPA